MLEQLVQILGAIAILAAYALSQLRRLSQESYVYLVLNLLGSAVLAVLAYLDRQWGFLLLEGSWAILSAWSLYRVWRRRDASLAR